MKVRILTLNSRYRLQKRVLGLWFDIDLKGKFYHCEQRVHFGHITVGTWLEANSIKLKLEQPKTNIKEEWKVL